MRPAVLRPLRHAALVALASIIPNQLHELSLLLE